MSQQGILVGIPAYAGHMYHGCFVSLMLLERACRARGIPIDYQVVANESLIPRARNQLAHIFLQSGYSHLLFIDADLEFDAADILRMYDENLPLLGGIYPRKNLLGPDSRLTTHFAATPLPGMPPGAPIDPQVPLPVLHVGTGLMMIQRRVLEAMLQEAPTYTIQGTRYHAFFDTSITPEGVYLSEDYHFCAQWRRLGGVVHAAPWVRCTHWGTHGFTGAAEKI